MSHHHEHEHDHSEEEEGSDEEEVTDLSSPQVVTVYRTASLITNKALAAVAAAVAPGKAVLELCKLGDQIVEQEVAKTHKQGRVDKGSSFPTCISINNICGNFSPLSDDAPVLLKEGDVVKIALGTQVDGFASMLAQTVVCAATADVTDRRADVITAANAALDAAVAMMKPGMTNTQITEMIATVAQSYDVRPLQGVLSHEMRRYLIDAEKVIINAPTVQMKVDECTIEENEVYTIDIAMSTGTGLPKSSPTFRTTVFKRNLDEEYLVKLQSSQYLMKAIDKKCPTFPFSLRMFDEKRARMGIAEMSNHGLAEPFPVMEEENGEFVAHAMATVLVQKSALIPYPFAMPAYVKSSKSVTDEKVKAVLDEVQKKKEKKDKKKAAGAAAAAAAPEKK